MSLEVHFLFYQSKLHKIANKQTNETKKKCFLFQCSQSHCLAALRVDDGSTPVSSLLASSAKESAA